MNNFVDADLVRYVEDNVIPLYDNFDKAHQRDHVLQVIERSLCLARFYDVDLNMVYAIAAYHDVGLRESRENHHVASKRIILSENSLFRWFDDKQMAVMADAVEDHRASSGHEPRTIYGKIVAEADRLIDPVGVMKRTLQYSFDHYPDYDKQQHYQRFKQHLLEKYSDSGYLKSWLPESDNVERLEELRAIIRDEKLLRLSFEKIFDNSQEW